MKLLALFWLMATSAHAFIPPVPAMLREMFENRKGGTYEFTLRHRVEVNPSGPLIIEERILVEKGRPQFLFKGEGFQARAVYERGNYVFSDRSFPSKSNAFLRYLLATSPDDLQNLLLNEGFIRRDQLLQFKPGYVPDGDPQTWQTKENYLRHPDIYLSRLKAGPAIAITGLDENGIKKTVYLDRGYRGVRRFEWREGQDVTAWNFDQLASVSGRGTFPKRLTFETGGADVITTDLTTRIPKDKALNELRASLRQAERASALPPHVEAALKVLLSFR